MPFPPEQPYHPPPDDSGADWRTWLVRFEVFEKNGLKRGPGLTSAAFSSSQTEPTPSQFSWTGGGPISGTGSESWTYQVRIRAWRVWPAGLTTKQMPYAYVRVSVGQHYPQDFSVYDGGNYEVRLDRK